MLYEVITDKAWDITKGTPNIKVAVIDTWFDITHPDLENKFIYNYDPYDSIEFGKVCGKNVHGTIVSSLVAAKTDGGGQLASVGFNTMMIGYKAWSGSYLQRAQHASLALGVDIITSSAGGWSCTSTTDTIEKVAVQDRITSYNVCYTKLLRILVYKLLFMHNRFFVFALVLPLRHITPCFIVTHCFAIFGNRFFAEVSTTRFVTV